MAGIPVPSHRPEGRGDTCLKSHGLRVGWEVVPQRKTKRRDPPPVPATGGHTARLWALSGSLPRNFIAVRSCDLLFPLCLAQRELNRYLNIEGKDKCIIGVSLYCWLQPWEVRRMWHSHENLLSFLLWFVHFSPNLVLSFSLSLSNICFPPSLAMPVPFCFCAFTLWGFPPSLYFSFFLLHKWCICVVSLSPSVYFCFFSPSLSLSLHYS